MKGYKDIFDEAEARSREINYEETFPNFRNWPTLYHFAIAPQHLLDPETNTLEQAASINYDLYSRMFLKGPSKGADKLDAIESRHIFLMTYLLDKIGKDWMGVVEIGGGYGNCFRLVHDLIYYYVWNIVDMQYMLKLQQWFLDDNGINRNNVVFTQNVNIKPRVVIATHSMSEFSLTDFLNYYNLISGATWFLYASHVTQPDPELLATKLAIIAADFKIEDSLSYEGGNSIVYLFKNKP